MAESTARVAGRRAGVWGLLGTLAPALVDLSTSNGFGAGDLWGLLFFTLPLLLVLVVSGVGLARKLAQRPAWLGLLVGGTVGAGIGLLWTLANALLLGPWFGAWSFPVLLCWTTGGALSLAAAATTGSGRGWRYQAIEGVVYLSVALAVLYVYRPAVIQVRHDQHLTLVYGRIHPAHGEPTVDDSRELLIPGEKELLARAGAGGSLEILGGHAANTTQEPRARILVLLRRPVDRLYRLLQPEATTVIYVQEEAGLRRFPTDAKVLSIARSNCYLAARRGTGSSMWAVHVVAGAASNGRAREAQQVVELIGSAPSRNRSGPCR